MHLIEMSDYTLAPTGSGNGIRDFYFALAPGDVCAIEAQNPDDGHEFLRALATLSYPVTGALRWNGRRVRLKSYRALLGYKKRIGYIAPDAALISNLTVRQNILLHRYYVENDLGIDLDDRLAAMCNTFGISHKMDRRPADLNSMERQMAIVIREIGKKPEILLLDRPEDFIGHAKFEVLVELFRGRQNQHLAGVDNQWISDHRGNQEVPGGRRADRNLGSDQPWKWNFRV